MPRRNIKPSKAYCYGRRLLLGSAPASPSNPAVYILYPALALRRARPKAGALPDCAMPRVAGAFAQRQTRE